MADLPKHNITPTDQSRGNSSGETDAPVEQTNQRRRYLLNVMKNVAIAGPIVLTLKNTPALAQVGEASCLSANISEHDHLDAGDPECASFLPPE